MAGRGEVGFVPVFVVAVGKDDRFVVVARELSGYARRSGRPTRLSVTLADLLGALISCVWPSSM